MKALIYFDANTLLSIEQALFADFGIYDSFDYCLINDSAKEYYTGSTVNVSSLLRKLTQVVKSRTDYPVLAHHLQNLAITSNMGDWTLAIFKPGTSLERELHRLSGFTRIRRALPYEVSGEDVSIYEAYHIRRKVIVAFSSVRDCSELAVMNSRAKGALAARISLLRSLGYDGDNFSKREYLQRVINTYEHCYKSEWVIKKIKECTKGEALEWVRARNRSLAAQLL